MRRQIISFAGAITIVMMVIPDVAASSHDVTHEDFEAARFSGVGEIDNEWHPLAPGMQYVLEGTSNASGTPSIHRVSFTVTDLTKEVDGVRTRVLYDVDADDGVPSEIELAFQAQDDDGNVWLLGEYPEEYEDGQFTGAPSTWLSQEGVAFAGVMMREDPRPGSTDYLQGLIESIEFKDLAHIVGFEEVVCVKVGCFQDVLVIDETNQFVPDEGFQRKYYARGVGNIKIDFIGGAEQETLELVSVRKLRSTELTKVRNAALRLDRRAYHNAADVYADSARAVRDRDRHG